MTDHKLIVLGQGGIGSAASYWASRRLGSEVLGLEQFAFGHGNGGSEDHSRIIRLSYHTPEYVALAKAAYRAWEDVESDSATELVLRTGGLDLAPANAQIGLDSYRESMSEAGVEFEELDATEIMHRWPQWSLADDVTGLYQSDAGIAKASIANATHRRMATEHGATLKDLVEVTAIEERSGEVTVFTNEGAHTTESLIIAAGGWSNQMLGHLGVTFPLEISLEQVVYLMPLRGDFVPGSFPIWIWMDVPSFYGFPVFGEPAVKVAWDRCEVITDVNRRTYEPSTHTTETIRKFVAGHLPGANGSVHMEKTCIYTLTPDRDFVVDRVPGTQRIFTAIGAGHAFKFASVLGKTLVELALDGETHHDLSAFAADRAILQESDPVRNYLV